VQVVDAFAGRMIASIPGLSQPQGTLYVPDGDKLFVANAADGHVNVYNGTTFKPIATIDFGTDPDNLRYDAASNRIYVGYGDGAIGVIDATTNKRLPIDYKLDGHPEGFQLETKGPRIFVNVADTKNIQVIDRMTGKVTNWALPKGHSANFPMALDEENRRVLIGTRKPSRLTVLDMDTGNVVGSYPCTGDMDDLFFDAERKRVYVAGGEGYLSVFQRSDRDHYVDMGKFATAVGARTGVWYVKRDRLYVAAPPSGTLGARLLVFEAQDY
jgi:DNA-binding beta-propeller fold protein YncE